MKYLNSNLNNPFLNLTIQQRILQTFRLVCPFAALILLIVLFALKSDVDSCYVVKLNCGHIDLAKGIYKILNELFLQEILQANSTDLDYFLDSHMPQSMVEVMTNFARGEISDSPQYFLMGFQSYCAYRYDTDYDGESDNINLNITQTCQNYAFNSRLDYTKILQNNGFDLVATYSHLLEDNSVSTSKLVNLVSMFKIVSILLFVLLPILIVLTLYVYSNRKGAPNLTKVTKLSHLPLFLSVGVCAAMTCSFALIIQFVKHQMTIVSEGLGKFLISMSYGPVFFGLFIATFVLVALTMLFWVVPMWCSNPPVIDRSSEEMILLATSHDRADNVTHLPRTKFSNLLRRKLHKSSSSNSNSDENVSKKGSRLSLINNSESENFTDIFNSSNKDTNEEELKKLGDQLAHRPRVRKSYAVILESGRNNSDDSIDEK